MKTILFSFENEADRETFVKAITALAVRQAKTKMPVAMAQSSIIQSAVDSSLLDPSITADADRHTAIFVSGEKLHEGPFKLMSKKFAQEANAHSGSISLKEYRGGVWKTIAQRRQQTQRNRLAR